MIDCIHQERLGSMPKIFGRNPNTNTTEEDIWDASQAWVPFASAVYLEAASTSANDASAGTGARTVYIVGLDSDYRLRSEILTLNGQTAVTSQYQYIYLYGAEVLTAGSGGSNAGTVYVADAAVTWTGGVPNDLTKICAYIATGENASHQGNFISPDGASFGLQSVTFTNHAQISRMRVYRKLSPSGVWVLDREYAMPSGSFMTVVYDPPLEVPQRGTLRFAVISSVAGAIATVDAQMRRA